MFKVWVWTQSHKLRPGLSTEAPLEKCGSGLTLSVWAILTEMHMYEDYGVLHTCDIHADILAESPMKSIGV